MRDTYYESLIVDYGTEKVLATRTDMGTSTAMRWIQQQLAELDGNLAAICHECVYDERVDQHIIARMAHVNIGDQLFNFEQVVS
jgi:predicted GTPase